MSNAAVQVFVHGFIETPPILADTTLALPALECNADAPGSPVDLTLPSLVSAAEGYIAWYADANMYIPVPSCSATGEVGTIGTTELNLPSLICEASDPTQANADISLPSLSVDAIAQNNPVAEATIALPGLSCLAAGFIYDKASCVLPAFRAEAVAETSILATSDLSFTSMIVDALGLTGNVATAQLSLPVITMSGMGYGEYITHGTVSLPLLSVSAFAETVLAGSASTVFVLNVRNMAVSEYTGYNFNSFTKFGDVYLGANSTGIHLLNGTKDGGANISAEMKFPLSELGVENIKRIVDAYVGILGAGKYELTLTSDDGVTRTYPLNGKKLNAHTIKADLARGVKGRYWQIGFKNKEGSYFKLESVGVLMEISRRRK